MVAPNGNGEHKSLSCPHCGNVHAFFSFENYGNVWLVRPLDQQSADLLERTAPSDALFFGGAMAVEPRFVEDVATALGLLAAEELLRENMI